jgi:CHAT domain-containing protein
MVQDLHRKTGEALWSRLTWTRAEAAQIVSQVPADQSKLVLDFDANLATAISPELRQYRYIHFATHGVLDSVNAEMSAVVLSLVDRQGHPEPGYLRARDLFNLNLPAELVVLSACETGLGNEVKGEGLIGLTRGLMYAGAKRVVTSLWSVDDEATATLMGDFYAGMLKQGKRPADALRAAQIRMWKQSQYRAPYFWAPFILQGDWQ